MEEVLDQAATSDLLAEKVSVQQVERQADFAVK
jgi:hypothetical protein